MAGSGAYVSALTNYWLFESSQQPKHPLTGLKTQLFQFLTKPTRFFTGRVWFLSEPG